ncbi:MAG TPA: 4-alpha-glucanotransferase [Thermoanaerobaculia bacterium]|nr:4-alpha-glucanotransferase [Thermoanaerobaculia bacterium]
MSARAAGLLLHPTSLPGPFGVGDLGPEASRFIEWAQAAGATLWQVLPLNPPGPGESPYGGLSAFAGNPLLVSPEALAQEGLLPADALRSAPTFPEGRLDAGAARRWKEAVLRQSWERFRREKPATLVEAFEAFRSGGEQSAWLPDWALFAALARRFEDAGWIHWPPEISRRESAALEEAGRELSDEIDYHAFLQFLFHRQWDRLRLEASRRGIALVGDVPIYVSHHSADVWAHRELFALDAAGLPETVAGVPPDYFSRTGQLWGYPLYRWDRMERDGYSWWIARFAAILRRVDLVRVDHFRGFASYWEVPSSARTAVEGRWVPGPGRALFEALRRALGSLPLIAEDLGLITDDVRELLATTGIPGMKVLQFAFSEDDSPHAPHRHVPNEVVYTGTHDNDTARGWFEGLAAEERQRALDYLGTDGSRIAWDLIRAAYESVADRAIVPLQDVLGLGSEARMNVPALAAGNWLWRARREELTAERAESLRRLAELTGRALRRGGPSATGD